jgi:1-acyl-sn-glycerol-3-phosphate acyltransferase
MKPIADYLLSAVYYIVFGLLLLVFHPIQWLAYKLIGSRAQQKVVHCLNAGLYYSLYLTGLRFTYTNQSKPDFTRPVILISNHQSMFDIILIIWHLRSLYPIFVSKKELSRGIPSISLNLRLSGAALINRTDSRQAIPEITRMAKWAHSQAYSAVIFPEGTRSRTSQLKPFATGGLAVLIKNIPNAQIIPIAISGNNQLDPKGFWPLRSFSKVTLSVLPVIDTSNKKAEEICTLAQELIKNKLSN